MAGRGWRTAAVAVGVAGALAAAGAVEAMPAVSAFTAASTAAAGFDDSLRPAPLKHASRTFTRRRPLRLLVVGDSVSRTLAEGIRPLAGRYHVVISDRGVNGCGISLGSPFRYFGNLEKDPPQCRGWATRWRQAMRHDHPDVVLLLVGRWELMDRVRDHRWMHIGQPAYDAYLLGELNQAIDVLSTGDTRVVLVTPPYFRRGLRPDHGLWPEDTTARVDHWNLLVRKAAAGRPGVSVADLTARLGRGYREVVGGVRLRYDGVHLTPQAGRLVGPWLLRTVVAAGR